MNQPSLLPNSFSTIFTASGIKKHWVHRTQFAKRKGIGSGRASTQVETRARPQLKTARKANGLWSVGAVLMTVQLDDFPLDQGENHPLEPNLPTFYSRLQPLARLIRPFPDAAECPLTTTGATAANAAADIAACALKTPKRKVRRTKDQQPANWTLNMYISQTRVMAQRSLARLFIKKTTIQNIHPIKNYAQRTKRSLSCCTSTLHLAKRCCW